MVHLCRAISGMRQEGGGGGRGGVDRASNVHAVSFTVLLLCRADLGRTTVCQVRNSRATTTLQNLPERFLPPRNV